MNKRPLNTMTPLLCITIRLENYIELRINDEYSTPIFQYRYEQYYSNPWKEPKKPIKTKLLLTYTSLILKNASWWPYRIEHSIKYKSVQKFLTLNQEHLRFAIGLYDEDYAEKQFVVMSTKHAYDVERLIQLIDSQSLIWKYTLSKEINYPNKPMIKKLRTNCKESVPLSKTFNRTRLTDKNQDVHITNDLNLKNLVEHNLHNQNDMKLMNHPDRILVQQHQRQNSQQYYRDYTEHKPLSYISNNLDSNNFVNDRRMIEPVQSTSNNSRYYIDRHKIPHRKERDESRTSKNKHSQTDTVYVVNDQKSWEVDIKHIRYDPIQGNILDDNGSVYLYTAHEID
ncbi:hypothetical protein MN116_005336 [Schistosoma mekongi]|uniref:Uncharacterized protein n=1 Tax=Schistosoma mekongi TaxID=38744 RepID=A0AAE2D5I9_SCHME|nr:hypothetical protein MN116_005336 [Schistosoma mekongi]